MVSCAQAITIIVAQEKKQLGYERDHPTHAEYPHAFRDRCASRFVHQIPGTLMSERRGNARNHADAMAFRNTTSWTSPRCALVWCCGASSSRTFFEADETVAAPTDAGEPRSGHAYGAVIDRDAAFRHEAVEPWRGRERVDA